MTLEEMHNNYGNYLLACLRLYGVPEQECEDVRQDLYLKLLKNKFDLSFIRHPKGFCSCMSHRAAIDWLRKAGRTPPMVSLSISDEESGERSYPELDTMAAFEWGSIVDNPNTERIARAMELAEEYEVQPGLTAQEVINDLLCDLSEEQIGDKYGVSHMTVSRWMQEWYRWVNVWLAVVDGAYYKQSEAGYAGPSEHS